jgi:hypothetical protein
MHTHTQGGKTCARLFGRCFRTDWLGNKELH